MRAVATITAILFLLVYAFALIRRHGLIDGFGHVIGGDLLEQRLASQITHDGLGHRLYDFGLQTRYEEEAVAPETLPGLIPFMSPPYVALAYWPLMPLKHGIAFALWTALGLISLVASLLLLGREYRWIAATLPTLLLLSLSFFPVVEGLMAGSNHMISLLLLTAVFLALKRGRDGAAGIFLGLQLFKPQIAIVLLAVLVFKRRWKAVLVCGAVALVSIGLSTLFVGNRSAIEYVRVIPTLTRLAYADGAPWFLLTSLSAGFIIPFGPAALSTALGTLASIAALGLVLHVWSGPWEPDTAEFDRRFAATLIATALISQYFLLHDLTILVLAAVLLTNYWMDVQTDGWATTRLSFAALWVACFLAPIVTKQLYVPIVPLALLSMGWVTWNADSWSRRVWADHSPRGASPATSMNRYGWSHVEK